MRITPAMISTQVAADLDRTLSAMTKQQELISSGRRMASPSDDPAAAAQALVTRSRQAAIDQYQKNIANARDALGTADSTVRSVVEVLTRVRELGVQGANDTNDALSRQATASEVNQSLESLVALANSRGPRGAAVFGGQETVADPYTVTRDSNGNITAVTVNPRGIDGSTPVEVGENLTVPTSLSGTTVFGAPTDTTYAFNVLIRLRDALNTNDAATVQGSLNDLGALVDRATLSSTDVGTRLGWLDTLDQRSQDQSVVQAGALSRLEDLDLVQAIQTLQALQTAYNNGIGSGAKLLQQSLLDFLK